MFITVADVKDKEFRVLHCACLDKYGYDDRKWVIENKRLKIHCKAIAEVKLHAQWIKKMEDLIMRTQMGQIIDRIDVMGTQVYTIKMLEDNKVIIHETEENNDFHVGDEVIYKDGRMFKLIKGGSDNIAA